MTTTPPEDDVAATNKMDDAVDDDDDDDDAVGDEGRRTGFSRRSPSLTSRAWRRTTQSSTTMRTTTM
jgi:hypothetical protein